MREIKTKVYIAGKSDHHAKWLNAVVTSDLGDSDLVLFTGGADINPLLYAEKVGKLTHFNEERDLLECEIAAKAMMLNKPIFGICRGAQLGCVLSGGKLIQHMNHPNQHLITMYDGTVIKTNSIHHQLQKPYNLHPSKYKVLAWARGLSNTYLNGENEEVLMRSGLKNNEHYYEEPELVYYRDTNWLGVQGHPELMSNNSDMNIILRSLVKLQIEDNLDKVVSLGIPKFRHLGKDIVFTDHELESYEKILKIRKNAEVN